MSNVQDLNLEASAAIVALVGAPNSGKTTLYNWLTGAHAKAVNYPGSTVDYMKGELAPHWKQKKTFILDTPGTYSLHAKSEDEVVTQKILVEKNKELSPHQVVVVLDGTQLSRHLLLAEQVRLMGIPMVLAITMADLLSSKKVVLNLDPLKEHFNCPILLVDGRLGGGVQEIIQKFPSQIQDSQSQNFIPWTSEQLQSKGLWAEKLSHEVYKKSEENIPAIWNSTMKWDRLFMHPLWGSLSFLIIMTALFSSIYYLAAPLMDQVDALTGFLSKQTLALGPENLFIDFISNGIITSFGAVFIFVPQIFILFLGMGFLESTGYLARAATLIDKPFSKLGLSGRSFVPFLSGYACAVPALMAARNINSNRERWIARFIIPLLSCSARLPVYGILLAVVFAGGSSWVPGLALAAIYIISMIVSAFAAGILNKIITPDKKSFFLMELPLFRRPRLWVILNQAWMKTKSFIVRAGPVIFVLTVFLWVGTTFPNYRADDSEKIQTSYLGQVGQKIEPVFKPMGIDWRGGIGLLAAFAAREVFVSTLAVVYNVTEDEGETGLLSAMEGAHFEDGTPIFTLATCAGLVAFFMIALQCLSTVGMMIKESRSVKLALIQLVAFNVVAYLAAVMIVQGLHAVGVA
jgi:ferrous iron transport protein B